jgi:tartrate-resistant acid phosphatase type 5
MSHSRHSIRTSLQFALLILIFFVPFLFVYNLSAQNVITKFAVIGDYGNNKPTEAAVATLVKSWNPAFIITTGDNNYPDGLASTIDNNIGQHYSDFIGNYQGIYGDGSPTIRFFPSLGNHDWLAAGARPYLDYFTLPGNERYYDFVRGDVHFFALDSDNNEPDGVTATSIQGNWLRTRLAASTAKWQVVYFHHPPYTSSATHSPSTRMRWPFQEWGADVVLAGHNHEYERLNINGLTYMVNGLGGASIYGSGTPVEGSLVRYSAAVGAQLVTVYDCKMVFDFYSVVGGGTLIDSYTLGSCDSASPTASPTASPIINTPTATSSPTATATASPIISTPIATASPTATAQILPTTEPSEIRVLASADAYVSPFTNNNRGSRNILRIDAEPEIRSYLRFDVPMVSGIITKAVLRVYATNDLMTPFSLASTSDAWSEESITLDNAPAPGAAFANSSTAIADTWVDVDISTFVQSAGQYNLVMLASSPRRTEFASRESSNPPQLILSVAPPTASPTAAATSTATATSPTGTSLPPSGTLSLNPLADAYISSDAPSENSGDSPSLRTDGLPTIYSYLRFEVPALPAPIISATLRVYATSSNSLGYTVQNASNAWEELTLSFDNAPVPSGIYGISEAISANTWTEANITALITGAGQHTLVLTTSSSTATAFASRESATIPELLIVYGEVGSLTTPTVEITAETSEMPTEFPTVTATELLVETATEAPAESTAELTEAAIEATAELSEEVTEAASP